MFKSYCQFCYQCYNNFFKPSPENQGVYISILNETFTPIYFIVQYTIDVRTFTKQSSILNNGESEKITIGPHAVNICFNVIDGSTDPPKFIYNVALPARRRHCYKLMETASDLELIETQC